MFIWLREEDHLSGIVGMLSSQRSSTSPTVWLIEAPSSRRDEMNDLRCMSFTSKGTSEIIVAGLQDKMLVMDLSKGEVIKQVRVPALRLRLRQPR